MDIRAKVYLNYKLFKTQRSESSTFSPREQFSLATDQPSWKSMIIEIKDQKKVGIQGQGGVGNAILSY